MLQVSVQADFLLLGFVQAERRETRDQIQIARALWEQIRTEQIQGFITPRSFDRVCSALSPYPNAQEVITSIRSVLEVLPHNPTTDELAATSSAPYDCAVELAYAKEYELDGIVANSLNGFSELPTHDIPVFLPGALLLEVQEMNALGRTTLSQIMTFYKGDETAVSPDLNLLGHEDDDAENSESKHASLSDEETILEIIKHQIVPANAPAKTDEDLQKNIYINLNLESVHQPSISSSQASSFANPMLASLTRIRNSSGFDFGFHSTSETLNFPSFWLYSIAPIAAIGSFNRDPQTSLERRPWKNQILLESNAGDHSGFDRRSDQASNTNLSNGWNVKVLSTTPQEFLEQNASLIKLGQFLSHYLDQYRLLNSQENSAFLQIKSDRLAASSEKSDANSSTVLKGIKPYSAPAVDSTQQFDRAFDLNSFAIKVRREPSSLPNLTVAFYPRSSQNGYTMPSTSTLTFDVVVQFSTSQGTSPGLTQLTSPILQRPDFLSPDASQPSPVIQLTPTTAPATSQPAPTPAPTPPPTPTTSPTPSSLPTTPDLQLTQSPSPVQTPGSTPHFTIGLAFSSFARPGQSSNTSIPQNTEEANSYSVATINIKPFSNLEPKQQETDSSVVENVDRFRISDKFGLIGGMSYEEQFVTPGNSASGGFDSKSTVHLSLDLRKLEATLDWMQPNLPPETSIQGDDRALVLRQNLRQQNSPSSSESANLEKPQLPDSSSYNCSSGCSSGWTLDWQTNSKNFNQSKYLSEHSVDLLVTISQKGFLINSSY
jgi:hypothetical protein